MTNAEPFLTNDPQLMEDKKNARILCSRFIDSPEDESVRKSILKELLGSCTENIAVKPPFHCDYGYNIFVGGDFFMNFDCVFLDAAPIRIGTNCMIGPKTCIYDPEEHDGVAFEDLPYDWRCPRCKQSKSNFNKA